MANMEMAKISFCFTFLAEIGFYFAGQLSMVDLRIDCVTVFMN